MHASTYTCMETCIPRKKHLPLFCQKFLNFFTPCKVDQWDSLHARLKRLKHTGNLFRKNLQFKGVS